MKISKYKIGTFFLIYFTIVLMATPNAAKAQTYATDISPAGNVARSGDFTSEAMGITDTQQMAIATFSYIIAQPTKPLAIHDEEKKAKAKSKTGESILETPEFKSPSFSTVPVQVEYNRLGFKDYSGDSVGFTAGYQGEFARGWEFGAFIPYKYTSLNDSGLNSKSNFAGLNVFLLYDAITERFNGPFTAKIGINAFTSIVSTSTDIYSAGKTSGGGGPMVTLHSSLPLAEGRSSMFSTLEMTGGFAFTSSSGSTPDSMFGSDALSQIVAQQVRRLDHTNTFTGGINLGLPIYNKYAFNVQFMKSQTYFSQPQNLYGQPINSTRTDFWQIAPTFSYNPMSNIALTLGYQTILGVDDFASNGVRLGGMWTF